jgi:hypothetical protein
MVSNRSDILTSCVLEGVDCWAMQTWALTNGMAHRQLRQDRGPDPQRDPPWPASSLSTRTPIGLAARQRQTPHLKPVQ